MLISILPLILDYLDVPFDLIETSKTVNKYCKKYLLTLRSKKNQLFCIQILKNYKWKRIIYLNRFIPSYSCGYFTDEKLKFLEKEFAGLQEFNLCTNNHNITDDGLQYLKNVTKLQIAGKSDGNITNNGLRYIPKVKVLALHDRNNNLTDACLRYIPEIEYMFVAENRWISLYNKDIRPQKLKSFRSGSLLFEKGQ